MSLPFIGRASAEALAERLRSLAHPMRLMILACLAKEERSVGQLERELGLRQPSLSQQLAELRQAGWVTTRREAKSVFYSLAHPEIALLLIAFSGLLGDATLDRSALLEALDDRGALKRDRSPMQAAVFALVGKQAL